MHQATIELDGAFATALRNGAGTVVPAALFYSGARAALGAGGFIKVLCVEGLVFGIVAGCIVGLANARRMRKLCCVFQPADFEIFLNRSEEALAKMGFRRGSGAVAHTRVYRPRVSAGVLSGTILVASSRPVVLVVGPAFRIRRLEPVLLDSERGGGGDEVT